MKKLIKLLVVILILLGGVNIMQMTNPGYFNVEALDAQRIIPSRPITIYPSRPIRPSQPIQIIRPSQPIN